MAQYGTDGVRVGMLLSSPAGNDLMFDVSYCNRAVILQIKSGMPSV